MTPPHLSEAVERLTKWFGVGGPIYHAYPADAEKHRDALVLILSALSSPMPSRDQIAHLLYEREKARAETACAVLKSIGKGTKALEIEPFEECADTWNGDAAAILSLFKDHQGS